MTGLLLHQDLGVQVGHSFHEDARLAHKFSTSALSQYSMGSRFTLHHASVSHMIHLTNQNNSGGHNL